MDPIFSSLLLFAAGTIAGFININAGGGSSITLPILIFLGLDGETANGTNRIAIFIQNISAIYSFKREKYSRFKLSLKLSLFTLPGAVSGALIANNISSELFEKLLGIVMIGIILSMVFPNKKKTFADNPDGEHKFSAYLAMFGVGFYGGFMQVGVGFLLMAALHHLMKLNLVYVNMHKVFIVFIYTIPALLVFVFYGNVDLVLGLILASGNAFGAWWGAKFSIRKGEKYIRFVLMAGILIMSLKLLGVY